MAPLGAVVPLLLLLSASSSTTGAGATGARQQRPRPGTTAPVQAVLPAVVELRSGNGSSGGSVWASAALFGALLPLNGTEPIRLARSEPRDACSAVEVMHGPGEGLLVQRGDCEFATKSQNAEAAGASLMLLVSNTSDCLVMRTSNEAVAHNLSSLYAISVDADVGEFLSSAMAVDPELRVVLWGVEAEMDINAALLWLFAVVTVAIGSIWSARDSAHAALSQGSTTSTPPPEDYIPPQPLNEWMAFGFIVMASVMLLLLSWLVNWVVMFILIVGFALVSWQALAAMLLPAVAWVAPRLKAWSAVVPCFGRVHGHGAVAALIAVTVAGVWVPCRNADWAWLLQDILGLSLCVLFLRQIVLPNLKVALILLPIAFCYDVFWVFIQPLLTHSESVMVRVATGGDTHEAIPMVIRIPRLSSDLPGYSLLGLGDIVLPGLLVAFTRMADLRLGLRLPRGYFIPILAGYGAGLMLTYLALMFKVGGSSGQPALLYLVPCTLGPLCLLACMRGHFWMLLRGKFAAVRAGAEAGDTDDGAAGSASVSSFDWSRDTVVADEEDGVPHSNALERDSLLSQTRQL